MIKIPERGARSHYPLVSVAGEQRVMTAKIGILAVIDESVDVRHGRSLMCASQVRNLVIPS